MLDHRMQILLDRERYERVARAARERRVSVAAVIREAIDAMPDLTERRRSAVEAILSASSTPVPEDPSELRGELDEAHDRGTR